MSYYSDPWLTVHLGDCREVMASMEPESVHCVVTSPPYWGLRDYGTASWEGGDEACDHLRPVQNRNDRPAGSFHGGSDDGNDSREPAYKHRCRKCGARRIDQQLGLEPTPEAYVEAMVAVFREVRRVLRPDGTVWLNLGDSYAGSWGNQGRKEERGTQRAINGPMLQNLGRVEHAIDCDLDDDCACGARRGGVYPDRGARTGSWVNGHDTLKPKDLVGIPWRVAFALQADGWYLRSDIIWAKPNPMPESVTDRPTKSHEYLFLLTKSARYWYDADAVREKSEWVDAEGHPIDSWGRRTQAPTHHLEGRVYSAAGLDPIKGGRGVPQSLGAGVTDGRRNLRSVWTVATQPYPGAHFATFPPKLIEPCIKAGCPDKACVECGAPWERVVSERRYPADLANAKKAHGGIGNNLGGQRHQDWLAANPRETTGWRPTCGHDAATEPGTTLDLFAGSGTTAMVANRLSRRAVLIDLNADYLGQVMDRNRALPLGLETA